MILIALRLRVINLSSSLLFVYIGITFSPHVHELIFGEICRNVSYRQCDEQSNVAQLKIIPNSLVLCSPSRVVPEKMKLRNFYLVPLIHSLAGSFTDKGSVLEAIAPQSEP